MHNRIRISSAALGAFSAVLFETIYGASFVFTKAVTGDYSTMTIQFWRFLIAFIGFLLLSSFSPFRIRFRFHRILRALPAALCYPVLYLVFETMGIRLTTASESGIIISSCPVFCILASTVFLRRKPTRLQTAGILTALFGTALAVLAKNREIAFSAKGYASLFLALFVYSFYSVSVESLSPSFSGPELTGIMLMSGLLFFGSGAVVEHLLAGTLFSLFSAPFLDPVFCLSVLYLSLFSSLLAFFLNNLAISLIGTNRTATFSGVDTTVSILLGSLVQHDRVSLQQILGVLLILGGVYLANSTRFSQPESGKSAP